MKTGTIVAAVAIAMLSSGTSAIAAPLSGGASGGGAIQGGSGAPGGGTGIPGAIVNGTTADGIGVDDTFGQREWRRGAPDGAYRARRAF